MDTLEVRNQVLVDLIDQKESVVNTDQKPEVTIVLQAEGGPKVELKRNLWLQAEGWDRLKNGQHQGTSFEFAPNGDVFVIFRDRTTIYAHELYAAFVEAKVAVATFQMSDLEIYAFDTEDEGLEGIEVID